MYTRKKDTRKWLVLYWVRNSCPRRKTSLGLWCFHCTAVLCTYTSYVSCGNLSTPIVNCNWYPRSRTLLSCSLTVSTTAETQWPSIAFVFITWHAGKEAEWGISMEQLGGGIHGRTECFRWSDYKWKTLNKAVTALTRLWRNTHIQYVGGIEGCMGMYVVPRKLQTSSVVSSWLHIRQGVEIQTEVVPWDPCKTNVDAVS